MNNLCVYCGSSNGNNPLHTTAAIRLGRAMLARGYGLVYGGAGIGLMGAIADCVLQGGGNVIGVIPEALARKEVVHAGLTRLYVVESMHERKATMARHADGFIAMPGGLGTLEELFEMLTWSQLGIHRKPCALLNSEGYYDKLVAFLHDAVNDGFIHADNMQLLLVDDDAEHLLEKMESYQAPVHETVMNIRES